ncbi:MAG: tRNA epoxyqueuosine(34) reductase QueG [Elainellaceae cyanobacterium]
MSLSSDSLSSHSIKQKALELGFHQVGIVRIDDATLDAMQKPVAYLNQWLHQGYHADMGWMEAPRRQDIRTVMPEVQSVICVALNYYTPHAHSSDPACGKISRYGWGRDYHRVLEKKLKALAAWLQTQHDACRSENVSHESASPDNSNPDNSNRGDSNHNNSNPSPSNPSHSGHQLHLRHYVDTGPVQDKAWAQQAGIGWVAKNSNVITRDYGSWVFLGELLTSLPLTPDAPHADHCGTCTRCIDACPTGAIAQPFVVDANRCIAYHTIENRAEELPEAIAQNLQGWVAGCDICQDVCPWNQRFAQETDVPDFQPYDWNVAPKLSELAQASDEELRDRFPASALRRIKPVMMRRNARANLP